MIVMTIMMVSDPGGGQGLGYVIKTSPPRKCGTRKNGEQKKTSC